MATYVDGFVITFPKTQLAAYKKMATEGKKMWMKYGALDYKECLGDDLAGGKYVPNPFRKVTNAKPSEVVVFSYIVYKSRAHRDKVNKQVMKYFSEKYKDQKMPVDTRHFSYGGFKTIVE